MSYILFGLKGVAYLAAFVVPIALFVLAQNRINNKFENSLVKAFADNNKKSFFGSMLIKYIAFAGVWLHETIIWCFAWICGFVPVKFSAFNAELKQEMQSGQLNLNSMASITLKYRDPSDYRNKIFNIINKSLWAISKIFTVVPYIAPVFVIAWFFRLVLAKTTYSLIWITTSANIPNDWSKGFVAVINFLMWGYSEILQSPAAIVGYLALALFLSYGLSLSKMDQYIIAKHCGVTILTLYIIILLNLADWNPMIKFVSQYLLTCLLVLPGILLAELFWTYLFTFIANRHYFGKHTKKA